MVIKNNNTLNGLIKYSKNELKECYDDCEGCCFEIEDDGKCTCRNSVLVSILEELQKYQKIGTAEEFKNETERQKPKIPNIWGDGYDNDGNIIYDMYDCPNCGKSYEIAYDDYKYCPECGQRIDRRVLENCDKE